MTDARAGLFNPPAGMAPKALSVERVASRMRECEAAVDMPKRLVSSTMIYSHCRTPVVWAGRGKSVEEV